MITIPRFRPASGIPSRLAGALLFLSGLAGLVRPAAGQADPRFGAMTHFAQGDNPAWAGTIASLGVPGVRDELYWDQVEAVQGVYAFPAAFDTYMAALRQDGISPLIVLDFANPNYDGGNTPYDAGGFTGYANYANAVLQHYGSQIGAVEIWNEYNGTWCTGPAANNRPATYAAMLQRAYASIKAARPDVTVAGGATAGIALAYWEQLMQAGALSSMDVLSVHPYRYNTPPEGIEEDIRSLQALVLRYNNGVPKPIWVSEIGWQIQAANTSTLAIDATTQAEYLVRAYALLLSVGAGRVYWYDFSDDPGLSTMGLADSNGAPRASAYALQTTIQELQNAIFVRREASSDGLYSILFTRPDGTAVRVMWSLAPTSFNATGIARMLDLTGNPLPVTGGVSLTGSPIFVEGPLAGLPPASGETLLADSQRDFSGVQGQNGWWYGDYSSGAAFETLAGYSDQQWSGTYPYSTITPSDQHPSCNGAAAIPVVRRWVSTYAGNVHVSGYFQAENTGGDGVGVTVVVNGQPATVRALIGSPSTTFQQNFDFVVTVPSGATIDFVVDPGPAADINFDATTVEATISATPAAGTFVPALAVPAVADTAVTLAPPVEAASTSDFSLTQGENGWSYGYFLGAPGAIGPGDGSAFLPMTASGAVWTGPYPSLAISDSTLSPSATDGIVQVAAVRRWTSGSSGNVQVAGSFQIGRNGDGVGVIVMVDGQPLVPRAVIGNSGTVYVENFSFVQAVEPGTTIDFVVDPGPGRDFSNDATALDATITPAP